MRMLNARWLILLLFATGGAATIFAVHVRGEAYLASHQGEAVLEFQKIINHREIVQNSLTGALAHLQLGRCGPQKSRAVPSSNQKLKDPFGALRPAFIH